MNDNETRVVQSVVWAVAAVLITLIACANFYWTFTTTTAIRAGLQQSVHIEGGYWTK